MRWRRTDGVAWRGGSKIRGARRAEQARQGSAIAACERIRPARADTPVRARSSVLVAIGDSWTSPVAGARRRCNASAASCLPPARRGAQWVRAAGARRGTATCSVDPGCRCRDGLGSTWRRRACPGQRFRALPAILGGAASALCGPPWCRWPHRGDEAVCPPRASEPVARRPHAAPQRCRMRCQRGPLQRRQTGTRLLPPPPVCGKAVLASGPAGELSLF